MPTTYIPRLTFLNANLAGPQISLVSPHTCHSTISSKILTKLRPHTQITQPDLSWRSGRTITFQFIRQPKLQPDRWMRLVPKGPYSVFGTLQCNVVYNNSPLLFLRLPTSPPTPLVLSLRALPPQTQRESCIPTRRIQETRGPSRTPSTSRLRMFYTTWGSSPASNLTKPNPNPERPQYKTTDHSSQTSGSLPGAMLCPTADRCPACCAR